MTDHIAIATIVFLAVAFVISSGMHGRAASQRDKARRELAGLYRQEADRQKRTACPDGRPFHMRTAVPGLCLDVPTGTLTTHKQYDSIGVTEIPSTIRTVNWKGL